MTRVEARRRARNVVWLAGVVSLVAATAWGIGEPYALMRGVWLARCTGWGALSALALALSVTPLSRVIARLSKRRLAESSFAAHRRALGLAAATMAALHLAIVWATYLRSASWLSLDQPFLRSGLAALGVLLLLAATSFDAVNRAARIKLWKPLHRLAYVAALFAFHHALLAPFAPRRVVLAVMLALALVSVMRLVGRKSRSKDGEGVNASA